MNLVPTDDPKLSFETTEGRTYTVVVGQKDPG